MAESSPGADLASIGRDMHDLVRELYPVCRSITGDGVRQTLARLGREIPLQMHEVPSGTHVFDWVVPREWNIRDAYVKDAKGDRIIDFRQQNLHVVSYSVPVRRRMTLAELRPHLHTLPGQPDLIPYRTSYYEESWGFCLSQRVLDQMSPGEYEVCIDSSLSDGHLTYGECFLPGDSTEEILVSCHICHPSLCDDNLSGLVVATFLARCLARQRRRHSYRFLFIPGTIGSITWLSRNEGRVHAIRHGLVLTCLGDAAGFTYKKSRQGNAPIDIAVEHAFRHLQRASTILDFTPYGYDERQYCSPGFDLPVGCLMRSHYGKFPEYHTSADNPDFVDPAQLAGAFATILSVFDILDNDRCYTNLNPKCEPQLGRRGLYGALGGTRIEHLQMALLWVLNLSDGTSSLLQIAERSGLPFQTIHEAARLLQQANLLRAIDLAPSAQMSNVSFRQ